MVFNDREKEREMEREREEREGGERRATDRYVCASERGENENHCGEKA